MKTVQEMKKELDRGATGTYVEAIDGCVKHDMPNSGYSVYYNGTFWVAQYDQYFACWDGWDNHTTDVGIFRTEEDAVRYCWFQDQFPQYSNELDYVTIVIWPDGDWCYESYFEDGEHMAWKGDDVMRRRIPTAWLFDDEAMVDEFALGAANNWRMINVDHH